MPPNRQLGNDEVVILNAAAATGKGVDVFVAEFRNIILSFATDGGGDADLTAKVQGSISKTVPDFDAAQSVANHWDNIAMIDLQDGAKINGDTGFVVAAADDYRLFEVNTNAFRWLNVRVTARTAGEITVKSFLFDNK